MKTVYCDNCRKEVKPIFIGNREYKIGFVVFEPYGGDLCFACVKQFVNGVKKQVN